MADIWFISDTHFFHENILKFKGKDEHFIRPDFKTVAEMNTAMIDKWNNRVKPQDKVYHLGDVACGVEQQEDFTQLMSQLNGHKRLILGNHDNINQPAYRKFERIQLWTGGTFKQYNFVASHIPLRPDQMRDGEFNVHGHIHQNTILKRYEDAGGHFEMKPDPQYICVCVEHTNYKPIHLDEIRKAISDRSS